MTAAVGLGPLVDEPPAAAGSLGLVFAVAGTIETTVDPSRPVVNELRLSIGIPPDPPAAPAPPAVGAVYLTFPWGAGPAALCTELEAQAIVVTPDVDAGHWSVVRSSAPGVGYYWILTPPPGGGPVAGCSCGFAIANIVSGSGADLPPTLCFASCWHAAGGTIDQAATPSFWRMVPLAITALESAPAAPTPGSPARLRWSTTGADRCRLDHGADDLPPSGELAFALDGPRTFRLTARDARSPSAVSRSLRVAPATGWTRLTGDAVVTHDGPVLLSTAREVLCLQPQAGSLLASRDGRAWRPRALPVADRLLGAAGCEWDGALALSGGLPASTADAGASFAIRSPDGRSWSTLTASAWLQRSWHGCAAFAGRLWAIGGVTPAGAALADAQGSADGRAWTALATVPWPARARPGLAVHDGVLWMAGGLTGAGPGADALGDVWRLGFDLTWEQGPAPPWSGARALSTLAVAGGRLHALVAPLGEQPAQLWALRDDLGWELVDAAAPIHTRRLLGLQLALAAFHGGLLAVSDVGAWWYGPPRQM